MKVLNSYLKENFVMLTNMIAVFIVVVASLQFTHGRETSVYDSICTSPGYDASKPVWYTAHPNACDKYIQCHIDEYMILVGEERQCAFSTFWDNEIMSCVGVHEAYCMMDPCKSRQNYMKYKANGNCRGYWQCIAGHSVAQCCKIGEIFDTEKGCLEDYSHNCTDFCFDHAVPKPEGCDKRATPIAHLFEQLSNGIWLRMECAPGTVYVSDVCACDMISDVLVATETNICEPEIYLPFDSDTNDKSGNGNSVMNTNVIVKNGSAIFNGNSKLAIPRFNNLDHITSIYINVKYVTNQMSIHEMAIVSNDCGNMYSIMLREDSKNINFDCRTNGAYRDVHVSLPQESYTTQPSYKNVVYQVDNGMLVCQNGQANTQSVKAPGPLRTVRCGIQIGYAAGVASFIGEIDEVTVYLCNPSKP